MMEVIDLIQKLALVTLPRGKSVADEATNVVADIDNGKGRIVFKVGLNTYTYTAEVTTLGAIDDFDSDY